MMLNMAWRMLTGTSPRLLARFVFGMCSGGLPAAERFRRRGLKNGALPPFIFISITSNCNLRCLGCWVAGSADRAELSADELDRIIVSAKKHGNRFFGILGGEPLMYRGLWDVLGRHGDCYFQLFTNGLLLDADTADRLRRLGNVTPLVSIEGFERVGDERRGGQGVLQKAWQAVENCRSRGLITGVASSLCQSNIDELLSDVFLDELIARGVQYLWYYIYRPVGPQPSPQLALSDEQIVRVRRFMVEARLRKPIAIIDSYWDEQGRAVCPAACGISHHVGPRGHVEPCPPIQLADATIRDCGLVGAMAGSAFLREFRDLAHRITRGCLLIERPDLLAELAARRSAADTSGRGTVYQELAAMRPVASHSQPGREIPEKSLAYRFAKRHWFFGFGAYG